MSINTIEISGVHCQSCKMLITDILLDEGVKISKFDMDLKKQKATLVADSVLSKQKITELIKSAGDYSVTVKQGD